ncbi:circularly permuted type 2 ATP-grasp protein [Coraliomargarita parva]|uniref:circularly permuted type 2 ATP-grasp protein n=1 Tax=Coraliomargarita parva TaxID=3014050 RepID=UPI0022B3386B|nr:circularly permuted type 2 ATP-grasp protein [Coraliomargarita parva]
MPSLDSNHSLHHFSDQAVAEVPGIFTGTGELRLKYDSIIRTFEGLSRKELTERQRRLDRAVDELGLQFSEMTGKRHRQNPWRLDLFPLALSAGEWQRIAKGVVQRALAFNAYATDLYGAQNILRERVISHDLPLRDPAFQRQLSGIEVPYGEYSQFGAFDLVDVGDGDWRVVEHHMGTPFGISHVLQNRRILSQVVPELYERTDVAPVAGFSTFLLEMLRAQSKRVNPHIVLLTTGKPGQAYFEEAFIARHMGLSIAQPGDLLVRESRLFLKTIRGLEPVDVLYRRVESSSLDPIAVPRSGGGIPGLINVWRKGNVSIVNAPGAGVTDNRALLRYDERIISYYRGEGVLLKSVKTYHLSDVDQRDYVAENRDRLILKPIQDHDIIWTRIGGRPKGQDRALDRLATKYPQYFVAQDIPEPSGLPRYRDGRFDSQGVYLRVYYILGKEPIVLAGGLARHSSPVHRIRRLSLVTEGLKDVLVPDSVIEDSKPKREPMPVGNRFSIGSRVAEALYWAGRYLERAENTARQFTTLEKLRWDQMASSEQRAYWPLLQSVAAATGQSAYAKRKRPPRDILALSKSLLMDPNKGASVRACLQFARNSLESVRETISPECREVLEEMNLFMRDEAGRRFSRSRLRSIGDRIVSEAARFNGTVERTMSHDDSWQFYRVGVFFERAMGTLLLLEVALPRIIESYRATDEENADLTALLRLLGSLDAYRRTFRSRAYIDRVAQLIIQGRSNPSSLSFCLRNLHYAIGTLSITGERKLGQGLLGRVAALIDELENFSLLADQDSRIERVDTSDAGSIYMPFSAEQIEAELHRLTQEVEVIHERIEDVFFSHQDAFARDPMLFDIG